jgi:hypothetical protein
MNLHLKFSAADQKTGMTLDELETAVSEARRLGRKGSAIVKTENRIGGRVRTIEFVEESAGE